MAKTEIKVVFKPASSKLKTTSIRAFIFDQAFNGGRIVIGTGEKINPKHWLKSQRLKEIRGIEGKLMYEQTNERLERFSKVAAEIFAEMNERGQLMEKDEFKKRLKIKLKTAPSTQETKTLNLIGFIADRIDNNYAVWVGGNMEKLKPRTLINKRQILTKLKSYIDWKPKSNEKVTKIHLVDFESMTMEFYDSFSYYLREVLKHSPSTRGKLIKDLKNFLSLAEEEGYKVNHQYKKFVCEKGEPKQVTYLDTKELAQLYNTDLSKHPALDRVRDLFVFSSFVGLRYSDVYRFDSDWVDKQKGLISFKQQKTGDKVVVPLSPVVMEILNKYDYKLPKISNQKANKHIKEACRIAGFDQVVRRDINGDKICKWQTITTHDARRSLCSNLYHAEVPTYSIMKISGHKSESAFLQYIGIELERNALEIGQTNYFTDFLQIVK